MSINQVGAPRQNCWHRHLPPIPPAFLPPPGWVPEPWAVHKAHSSPATHNRVLSDAYMQTALNNQFFFRTKADVWNALRHEFWDNQT